MWDYRKLAAGIRDAVPPDSVKSATAFAGAPISGAICESVMREDS